MLTYRNGTLQLWLDAHKEAERSTIESNIRQELANDVSWQIPAELRSFSPPLNPKRGELTAKGTICRSRILENRFATRS
ncbi:hypothetical protein RMSM_04195 [Rhodopirellula maiorica SM1]|uniref:Uncharacterized protein n=2 Tax=Novipirellula TaxID=2795426 RepID=M5RHW2_9BACT|nr:hypothetical protein RMSM_04195 [Rhodopirellula maiorica SM1]